jgi:hypothetical protein
MPFEVAGHREYPVNAETDFKVSQEYAPWLKSVLAPTWMNT